ncbi:hypothetical protein [Elioraea tepidiphila]|uniref:hypothetical protein n=1 Tax=Elioraea tepidiphila TaxID=457934 RepID=UPI002FDB2283
MTSANDPTAPAGASPGAFDLSEVPVEHVAAIAALSGTAGTGDADAAALRGPGSAPDAMQAARITVPMRIVSGSYRGRTGPWRLDLRVDVDGVRPLRQVSGDFFRVDGGTVSYTGSFAASNVNVSVTPETVTIYALVNASFPNSCPRVRIIIPRRTILQAAGEADVQWLATSGQAGTRYLCLWESRFFRTVDLEEDVETGVTPFESYNTGALSSGGPARTLYLTTAFVEAGIEMRLTGEPGTIATAPGGTWSNAELHAAMEAHFSQWENQPQWKVWLLHAREHDLGSGLAGIMFDQRGRQRQGCAVFYAAIAGTSATRRRDQLFTCMHELGHCFNLYHSFSKTFTTPPRPDRPDALSWMNYPQNFPGGQTAFWSSFPFQFDDLDTIHLRHGFRDNVIMGGNPFGEGAALEGLGYFAEPEQDGSGLALELRADRSFRLGEPVVVELKLSTRRAEGITVHRHLHPADGFVTIAIQKPGGATVVHRPLIEHCIRPETVVLDAGHPAIYDSAYIGCGEEGLAFGAPGLYRLRAVYLALDGSRVVSDTLELRVRGTHHDQDEAVADLLLDEQVGTLFTLLGSEGPEMASANARIERLVEEHKAHPLALYGELVQGYVRARPFKLVLADEPVQVREARPAEAVAMLDRVVDVSIAPGKGLDSISLNQIFRRMIAALKTAGDDKGAVRIGKRMLETYRKRGLKPHVLAEIERQRDEALGGTSIA